MKRYQAVPAPRWTLTGVLRAAERILAGIVAVGITFIGFQAIVAGLRGDGGLFAFGWLLLALAAFLVQFGVRGD